MDTYATRQELPAGSQRLVLHWQTELQARVGVSAQDRARMLGELMAFCARHATTPAQLLVDWSTYPELQTRRYPRSTTLPDLSAESFVVHNGVNIFGDLICVPTTPEALAEQRLDA